ncbi:MAG: hypothetical protein AB7P20_05565 [Rhizobiaceae bacterium]
MAKARNSGWLDRATASVEKIQRNSSAAPSSHKTRNFQRNEIGARKIWSERRESNPSMQLGKQKLFVECQSLDCKTGQMRTHLFNGLRKDHKTQSQTLKALREPNALECTMRTDELMNNRYLDSVVSGTTRQSSGNYRLN